MTVLRRLAVMALFGRVPMAMAVPPLVIGDVPTADPGTVEVYAGVSRVKTGGIEWAVPANELVLGISRWQELTVEAPFLIEDDGHGVGDIVLGTKLMLLAEAPGRPGLAGSVEWKLANGDRADGLGSGSMELGLLMRAQKSWGWFTAIANAGYTLVGDPRVAGVPEPRRNTGFLGVGGEAELHPRVSLLADLYWRSADTFAAPARVAGDAGFKCRLAEHLAAHGAVGTSLRPGPPGGPQLRVYLGLKLDFAAF